MKRLYTVFSLLLLVVVLAAPAVAHADSAHSFTPMGWTWDEV
jgi:hypothetical protein